MAGLTIYTFYSDVFRSARARSSLAKKFETCYIERTFQFKMANHRPFFSISGSFGAVPFRKRNVISYLCTTPPAHAPSPNLALKLDKLQRERNARPFVILAPRMVKATPASAQAAARVTNSVFGLRQRGRFRVSVSSARHMWSKSPCPSATHSLWISLPHPSRLSLTCL